MLTTDQLNFLKEHLKSIDINYEETFNEFFDHYATLTEANIADGLSFKEAHKKAYRNMGGRDQLYDLQQQTQKAWREQLSDRHWRMILDYFRWPIIALTILLTGVIYKASGLLPLDELHIVVLFFLVALSGTDFWVSFSMAVYNLINPHKKPLPSIRRRLIYRRMYKILTPFWFIHFTLAQITLNHRPVEEHIGIRLFLVAVAVLTTIYSFSLFQLYREQLKISR